MADEKPKKRTRKKAEAKAPEPETPTPQQGPSPFLTSLREIFTETAIESADDRMLEDLKARFGIRDKDTANWAAGKIAMWQAEVERRKETAKDYIREAQRNLERMEYLFKWALEEWAKENLDYGKKSVKLPSATLQFRTVPDKLEIEDEEKALKWATLNLPDAVSVKEYLLLDPLKEFMTVQGVVPDGARVIPEHDSFSIK